MELTRIKKSVASLAVAGALFGGTVVGVGAAKPAPAPIVVDFNSANGLIAAVVDALVVVNLKNVDVAVIELNDSLNDLEVLNNSLNDLDIIVQDVNVLSKNDIKILERANIDIDDVVGVAILSGGDIIVFR
jgi:hypothetical protein